MIEFLNTEKLIKKQLESYIHCYGKKEGDEVYTITSTGGPTLYTDEIPLPTPINSASISLQINQDSYNARFGFVVSNSLKNQTNNSFLPYLKKHNIEHAQSQHLNPKIVSNALYLSREGVPHYIIKKEKDDTFGTFFEMIVGYAGTDVRDFKEERFPQEFTNHCTLFESVMNSFYTMHRTKIGKRKKFTKDEQTKNKIPVCISFRTSD